MTIISQRMTEIMAEQGLKMRNLEEITGISRGTLSKYISGKIIPKTDNLQKISKALNVDEQWLMGLSEVKKTPRIKVEKDWVDIPIYAQFNQNPTDHLALPFFMMFKGQAFANVMEDDSMYPKIQKRDLLIFQETSEIESGEIGFFNLNGVFYCRRLKKLPDESIWLFADNPKYDPIPIRLEDNFEPLGLYKLKITQ